MTMTIVNKLLLARCFLNHWTVKTRLIHVYFSHHMYFFCVGNPNGHTLYQGYQGQHFPEPTQWSGNMEQQNYTQQTINGSEMMNSHQPMGVRREEAVYNPRGPGRGGMIHYLPSKGFH